MKAREGKNREQGAEVKRGITGVFAFGLAAVCLWACETPARNSAGDEAGQRDAASDAGLPLDAGSDSGNVPDTGLCGASCIDIGGDCSDCDCCDGLLCDEGTCVTCIAKDRPCAFDGECCPSSDPSKGAWCNGAGTCTECARLGGPCTSDHACCWESPRLICSDEGACVVHCFEDKDCAPGEVCASTNVCLPTPCSADPECGGRRCCAGLCNDDCGYGPASACAIITKGGVVSADRTIQLVAVATSATGNIVTGLTVEWATSDESKVKVDAEGTASGQAVAGEAAVSAGIGDLECGSVNIVNLPPKTPGRVRVVAIDRETGRPVPGAPVVVGSGAPVLTTAGGVAESEPSPGGVHVFHADYSYVSILGAALDDHLVHLTPVEKEAGGYKAHFDFSRFRQLLREGLAGCSVVDALGLGVSAFWGEILLTHTKGNSVEDVPTFLREWEVMNTGDGFAVQTADDGLITVKDSFSKCAKGRRSAWAFGVDINPAIWSGIDGSEPRLYIAIARHALVPLFAVEPLPLIPTPTDDSEYQRPISKEPFIPDYQHFPGLEMAFGTPFMIDTDVSMPLQPKSGESFVRDVVAFEGVYLPQMGFVPLAFAQNTDLSHPRDGIVDETDTLAGENKPGHLLFKSAPPYRGLEGHGFMTVFMALEPTAANSGATLDDPPSPVSATIRMTDTIETFVDLSQTPFLEFAGGASFDRTTREIRPAQVEGATFLRYAIGLSHDRSWHVYVPRDAADPIRLPSVPAGLPDTTADSGMTVHAASLRDGLTMDHLFSTNTAIHPDDMLPIVERVSSLPCFKRFLPSDRWYKDKCMGSFTHPACEPSCELLN